MDWFRFYHEVLNDAKVQTLPAPAFKAWVNLLCFASQHEPRGQIGTLADVSFALRMARKQAANMTFTLCKQGLLETEGERYIIHNWSARQFASDDATERVRKHRGNVSRNNTVTPPETDREIDRKSTETEAEAEAEAVSEPPQQLETSLREGSNIFRLYEDLCGTITPHMADVLRAAETEYPPGWIAPAFEEASEANVRKWKYVEAILKNWSESGFPFEEDDDDGDDEQESENWYEKAKERARERLALEARSGTYAGPTL